MLDRCRRWALILACVPLMFAEFTSAAELPELLQTIRNIGPEGQGNREAAAAWQELIASKSPDLIAVLSALDDANPLAENWLRSAFETLADRQLRQNRSLPAAELEKFIRQTEHNPRARRLAFEWLTRVDPQLPDRLIPGMLNDPSVEFRRDAVERLLTAARAAEETDANSARSLYQQALVGARDDDQIKAIIKPLEKLGYRVDLPAHFGFILDWQLIGPFDNTDMKGFDVPYPPEIEIDLAARYPGKEGDVTWESHQTSHDYGILDLAKETAPHKGAVTYAFAEFITDAAQEVDIRLGTPNAWKLWVNGEYLFGRQEYHRGMQLDQYQVRARLKPGKNQILLKVCQNEQKDDWAQRWQFQLRVCDSAGTAILSKARPTLKSASAN